LILTQNVFPSKEKQMSNFPTPGVYNIDVTHSSLSFVVRHLVV